MSDSDCDATVYEGSDVEPESVPPVPVASVIVKDAKSKKVNPAVHWDWVVNNYPEDFEKYVPLFQKSGVSYVFQQETGESGTPHLQGYMKFPEKVRPLSVFPKEVLPASWRVCRNKKNLIRYCSMEFNDDGSRKRDEGCQVYANMAYPKPLKLIEPTFDWQLEIMDLIRSPPDDRTIHWYWSAEGGVGKTQFCKYLHARHGAAVLNGKSSDVRNGVVAYVKRLGTTPELCVMNIPRCYGGQYVSYEAFENIKDMFFYSGKYEGGEICGNSPHLFIFANHPPDLEKMSADRWRIVEIS